MENSCWINIKYQRRYWGTRIIIKPEDHNKGIGYASWCKVEEMYPHIKQNETYTPYFEKRNIHFYVNR